ncbi:MAG: (Fe-S)-binding protein [Gemmatimonadetes bacterium]|nr:(Fe-S)-binding protein [Gemmatimonadota bacterium]
MADRSGFEGLDACVHCGFCLQACPTFLATGDEADSPRGRIELMRALESGALEPTDPDLRLHLDRCLGCRGCEPVCPSGVAYALGLEAARERLTRAPGVAWPVRAALWALTGAEVSGILYGLARLVRATGLPGILAGRGRVRFAMGMLAATKPDRRIGGWAVSGSRPAAPSPSAHPPIRRTAVLFRGCIMDGLFAHVHAATIRTLAANGYEVREVPGQVCCGALHVHAGLRGEARALARANIAAFGDGDAPIVVNSAGCGAMLKEYGHGEGERGASFAARVKDVTELLAERGPVPGAPLPWRVAYDPPCHLLHAQRVAEPPLKLLAAIPGLDIVQTADAAQCCGSAGLFTLVQPEMSRAVLAPKLEQLRAAAPQVVATGNPGCVMQLGAGLRAADIPAVVRHPVELLDESYRAAGFYG